jgi:hypothetical protein
LRKIVVKNKNLLQGIIGFRAILADTPIIKRASFTPELVLQKIRIFSFYMIITRNNFILDTNFNPIYCFKLRTCPKVAFKTLHFLFPDFAAATIKLKKVSSSEAKFAS